MDIGGNSKRGCAEIHPDAILIMIRIITWLVPLFFSVCLFGAGFCFARQEWIWMAGLFVGVIGFGWACVWLRCVVLLGKCIANGEYH